MSASSEVMVGGTRPSLGSNLDGGKASAAGGESGAGVVRGGRGGPARSGGFCVAGSGSANAAGCGGGGGGLSTVRVRFLSAAFPRKHTNCCDTPDAFKLLNKFCLQGNINVAQIIPRLIPFF